MKHWTMNLKHSVHFYSLYFFLAKYKSSHCLHNLLCYFLSERKGSFCGIFVIRLYIKKNIYKPFKIRDLKFVRINFNIQKFASKVLFSFTKCIQSNKIQWNTFLKNIQRAYVRHGFGERFYSSKNHKILSLCTNNQNKKFPRKKCTGWKEKQGCVISYAYF